MLTSLVSQKTNIWAEDKQNCYDNINEIAEYFAGNRNWGKNIVDQTYADWFKNMADIIVNLDFKHSTKTGRKI